MDYIGGNKRIWWYKYPKTDLSNEDLLFFSDGIQEIVPDKLKNLMDRQDELIHQREKKLEIIQSQDLDEASLHFWCTWVELEFSEYFVIQRWLRYWLSLLVRTGQHVIEEVEGDFTPTQLLQAKTVPIINIYEGKLSQNGSRYKGLCPFHKEKTPSFTIFEEDNSFYCFGCHEWGDVIDFYRKVNNANFPATIKALLAYG